MIHDCLGHVPGLMNADYAELLTLIGKAASTTSHPEQVLALKRFSWFSIEFGLIEEEGETKVFGAGILSSTGEIPVLTFRRGPTSSFRDQRGHRHRLRPLAHARFAVHHSVVRVFRGEIESLVRRFAISLN